MQRIRTMAKEITIIIDGERYEFRKTEFTDVEDVCASCAFGKMKEKPVICTMCDTFDVSYCSTSNFQKVEADTPAPHPEYATHEELEALRRELNEWQKKGTVNLAKIPLIDGQLIIDGINAQIRIEQRIKNGESIWDKKD